LSASGSPRGTIHLYPANEGNPGPTQEEVEEKQDNRGSIGDELEEIQGVDGCETRSEIERNRSADTIYNRDMHPYIDTLPRDNSKHIFIVYPEKIGDRAIDGHYFVVIDELNLKTKPILDFWGSAYDFIDVLRHEIPSITQLIVNVCDNKIPSSILKVLGGELWKYSIDLFSGAPIAFAPEKVSEPPKEDIGVETLEKAVQDPTMRSMLQDPMHKGRGLKLSKKVGRVSRILKIAYHVIQTPADELDGPDTRWSIVPDTPSEENEQEAVEQFSTRDKAVARLNEMEGPEEEETEIEEESTIGGKLFTVSECRERAKKGNITHDWLIPEDGQKTAWELRTGKKQKSLGDWEA